MADKWIPACPGIRYKEHPARKHGKKPDRYWVLQYRRNNKTYNEAVGWWSQGASQAQAEELLGQLRHNWRTGQGPQTLKDMRAAGQAAREIEAQARAQVEADALTLAEFWERTYLPRAENVKSRMTVKGEKHLFKNWIRPTLGNMAMKNITPPQVTALLDEITKAGRSPRTAEHAKAVLSAIISLAIENEALPGQNPCNKVKLTKYDNRRTRFLTPAEARQLLDVLKAEEPQAHDEALLSLFCGLRAGEIFALTWADVNFDTRQILIRDPKNKRNRFAYMTSEVEAMLKARHTNQTPNALVFHGPGGQQQAEIGSAFRRVVADLGFNMGLTDPRQKVVFHSLRHTYASWLVQAGEAIYTVQQLMGHSTLAMTERYSHLAPDHLRQAAERLEGKLNNLSMLSTNRIVRS
jgi:integrase